MNEVEALKERWLATKSFDDEQRYLSARVEQEEVPCVEMNPSGDWTEWLAVIVRRPTGVVYMHQVGGIACHHYLIEGFAVMIGPWKYEPDSSGALMPLKLDLDSFINVFHEGKHCVYGVPGDRLPPDRLKKLRRMVADVTYWRCDQYGPGEKPPYRFCLDESRIDEIVEAWIPVDTVDGPGVLLYQNCD